MKKFLIIAAMMASATSLMAQKANNGLSWALETGIGTEWEIGGRAQYALNNWLSWDVVNAKYALDFNDNYNWNEFTVQTGLRGFSPTFGPNLKAFLGLDLGYGLMWKDGNSSHFALDVTAGLYVWKNVYMGYGFGMMTGDNDWKHKDHLFRIGFDF